MVFIIAKNQSKGGGMGYLKIVRKERFFQNCKSIKIYMRADHLWDNWDNSQVKPPSGYSLEFTVNWNCVGYSNILDGEGIYQKRYEEKIGQIDKNKKHFIS